ncbi:type I restriction enzyme, R subunit [Lishizhenia tianjinensis]|uniref:Type I restriction enzyme, R subunit n=1 Tax=Lishizhenia tianjinensis TaxID=477690 RepID=A0A1I6XE51_9FLAO|nr:DEAD/DEAH box helicase family protein [Lishizhenia tianjinensis]SFT36292.1 type I restriction enzyme, R subunit [Lishizhenia tianjinensis]
MSNFKFLATEWRAIYKEAKEAEKLTFTSPKACAVICRSALEKTVNWLFNNDPDLERPYRENLGALLHEQCFKDILKPSMFREIYLLKKIGDNAAHGNSIRKEEALVALQNLYRFTAFVAVYYSENEPLILPFDESLIPTGEEIKQTLEEIQLLEKQLNLKNEQALLERKQLEEQAELIASLQQQLLDQEQNVKARKVEREQVVEIEKVVPVLVSEAKTRQMFIDVFLKEAGWSNLREGYELEYEVKGMPLTTNKSGKGYADYVLWGDNGLPLAVIEAKKTMADARKGKHQAQLYADCLEQMHQQRPIIFYTNGFENFIWDDTFYPDREVQGFYTKDELQLLIDRRSTRKDIREYKVNENIAGRYYQKEALQRVAETFVGTTTNGELKAGGRKALLVMATGSGKTRTSAALVDMLTKCNWVKRVLFLADRNALVTQAKNAFNEHLPHLSAVDLTKEKEDGSTRIVFSTYPTIMNKIDALKTDDERYYGVGHFDLIIIDEAHRSVYKKYGAIFEYFDSLLVGLTATPIDHVDRSTYQLFRVEDKNPTYGYELRDAVKDGFLVPFKGITMPIKFMREGIRYEDLDEREKEEYEEKFGDPLTGEIPESIEGSALHNWLFNTDTVDKALNHLMTHGIKVEGGDKLGKTIIFANNHKHAVFIEERFNNMYPEHAGNFLRVIDNYESKAQDLLDKFTDANQELNPQIAVSVDMMDTGVDAPRVVNLMFFKAVKSYAKFWQMIGRGTRLCPNLFGPNRDKKDFLIFDLCENFEFFGTNPDGIDGGVTTSLTQRIFEMKLDIMAEIREKMDANEEERELNESYTRELFERVSTLDEDRFQVKMKLRAKTYFSNRENWNHLKKTDYIDLKSEIAPIILPKKGDHELARRFDIIMLTIALAKLTGKVPSNYIRKAAEVGKNLSRVNVPDVKRELKTLDDLQSPNFWKQVYLRRLDEVRLTVRELMKYLESEPTEIVYTSLTDDVQLSMVNEDPVPYGNALATYRERVESYIRKNKHHLIIQKLRNNEPITKEELEALETLLFDGEERGTKETFTEEFGEQPLGVFIRSIVGLDIQAANAAFSEFIQLRNLKADQMTFIKNIISFLEKNGTIDKSMLFEAPFTDINDQGLLGVFDDADAFKVISLLDRINENAEIA